jgi:hypothetical protein
VIAIRISSIGNTELQSAICGDAVSRPFYVVVKRNCPPSVRLPSQCARGICGVTAHTRSSWFMVEQIGDFFANDRRAPNGYNEAVFSILDDIHCAGIFGYDDR